MFKLVLIALPQPYSTEPPLNPLLSLSYIASYVADIAEVKGIDFRTISEDYNKSDYLKHIPLDGNMYVVSSTSPQYTWLKQVCKYLKDNTSAVIVAEGQHPTNFPKDCVFNCNIDIAIIRHGEQAIQRLIKDYPKQKIKGIAYKIDDQYYRNIIRDMYFIDDVPFPNRDIFNLDKYNSGINGEKAIHIIASRGCFFRCFICNKHAVGTSLYSRSISNIMAEIDVLKEQGYKAFVLCDKVFTVGKERTLEFCKEIKKRKVVWRCHSHANTVDWVLLETMKEAGLADITYDIEIVDSAVLRKINREYRHGSSRRAIMAAHLARVPVRCNIRYGLPNQKRRSLCNTINLIHDTFPDEINLKLFQPQPSSRIWKNPKEFGLKLDYAQLKEQNYLPFVDNKYIGTEKDWIVREGISSRQYQKDLQFFKEKLDLRCRRIGIKDTV